MKTIYRLAFREGPGGFFPSYRSDNKNFQQATTAVASALARNNVETNATALAAANPVTKAVIDKLISQWRVLGAKHAVQAPPISSPVNAGWAHINRSVPPGSRDARLGEVITELLNPPYGYDSAALALLFAAWFGYYAQDLSLSINGSYTRIGTLLEDESQTRKASARLTPTKFIAALSRASVTRRDAAEIEREADALISQLDGGYRLSMADAPKVIAKLMQVVGKAEAGEAAHARITSTLNRLTDDLAGARNYDARASLIIEAAKKASGASRRHLLKHWHDVRTLPSTGLVTPSFLLVKKSTN